MDRKKTFVLFVFLSLGLFLIGREGWGKSFEIGIHRVIIEGSEGTLEEIGKTLNPFLLAQPGTISKEDFLRNKIAFKDFFTKCRGKGGKFKILYSFVFPVEEKAPVNIEYIYGNDKIILLKNFNAYLDKNTGGIVAELYLKEYDEQTVDFLESLGLPAVPKYTISTALLCPEGGVKSITSGIWGEKETETGTMAKKLDYFLLSAESLEKGLMESSPSAPIGEHFRLSLQRYSLVASSTTLQEFTKGIKEQSGKWEVFVSRFAKKGIKMEYKGEFSFLMTYDSPISFNYKDGRKELKIENLTIRPFSKDFVLVSISMNEKEEGEGLKFSGQVKVPLEGFAIIEENLPQSPQSPMDFFVVVVRRW
jgi:hypothetical protein